MCLIFLNLLLIICKYYLYQPFRNAPVPFFMGIEEKLRKEAEINVNDGTYIIDLDSNKIYSKAHTAVTLYLPGR